MKVLTLLTLFGLLTAGVCGQMWPSDWLIDSSIGPEDTVVVCEPLAGTYVDDWDSMTDVWTEYTSAWSCYN